MLNLELGYWNGRARYRATDRSGIVRKPSEFPTSRELRRLCGKIWQAAGRQQVRDCDGYFTYSN